MHAGLSPENMYLRFFTVSALSAEREAQRICRPPDDEHAALLAWLDGQLVGVASYELQGQAEGLAEIAFAVPDHMHGRGVATLLLEHLVSLARGRGLRGFTAETLSENTPMLPGLRRRRAARAQAPVLRDRGADVPVSGR
jgi:GNAT superfamily N-acetyltransferase